MKIIMSVWLANHPENQVSVVVELDDPEGPDTGDNIEAETEHYIESLKENFVFDSCESAWRVATPEEIVTLPNRPASDFDPTGF